MCWKSGAAYAVLRIVFVGRGEGRLWSVVVFLGSARLVIGIGTFGETVLWYSTSTGLALVFLFFLHGDGMGEGAPNRGWKLRAGECDLSGVG